MFLYQGLLVNFPEETREATASLRQSAEQQERLYQMSALDFQRRMDDAARRRPKRMEARRRAQLNWLLLFCRMHLDHSTFTS